MITCALSLPASASQFCVEGINLSLLLLLSKCMMAQPASPRVNLEVCSVFLYVLHIEAFHMATF